MYDDMKLLECRDFSILIGWYTDVMEFRKHEDIRYRIARINFDNAKGIAELVKNGYVFHDRVLKMEINILGTREIRARNMNMSVPVEVREHDFFRGEEKSIAYQAYTIDRRFQLEQEYDSSQAKSVIDAYMDFFMEKKCKILESFYKNKVTGFTTVRQIDDNVFENVLGAVGNVGMTGKISAYILYSKMMDYIAEWGGKRYLGFVSSANAASINLHYNLGARVAGIIDEYILRCKNS